MNICGTPSLEHKSPWQLHTCGESKERESRGLNHCQDSEQWNGGDAMQTETQRLSFSLLHLDVDVEMKA